MISVSFIVKKLGEVCGYVSLPNKKGIYRQFAVVPMSGVNDVFGGYANIKLVYNDVEEYEGGFLRSTDIRFRQYTRRMMES